jgi:hypothetical protein
MNDRKGDVENNGKRNDRKLTNCGYQMTVQELPVVHSPHPMFPVHLTLDH